METVKGITLTALPPDKQGSITVFATNKSNRNYPETKCLRPLFLVPDSVPRIKNSNRNVCTIPKDCTHVEIETTRNQADGRHRSFYLGLRVVIQTASEKEERNYDAGPKI